MDSHRGGGIITMKRNVTLILAALLAVSLTACNNSGNTSDTSNSSNTSTSGTSEEQISVASATELLTNVWNSYKEDDKFPTMGGTPGGEVTDSVPGKFSIDDANALDVHLAFPAASADKIDDAASLIHMMNANTFTCGAYHVKDAGTISALSSEIKDSVMNRQWMCGFPEKLVIVKVGDYIVSVFGNGELIDTFIGKLTAEYTSAEKLCDEPIEMGGDPVADAGGFAIPVDWQRTDNDIMYL